MKVERLGFGRYRYIADPPAPVTPAVRQGVMKTCTEEIVPVQKVLPVRHEGYRRLVAMGACKVCGIVGYSQCAHANTGKSAGSKVSDLMTFALCASRPGVVGCHVKFDQGALFPKAARRAIEVAWAADTRRAIFAAGKWPADLPWDELNLLEAE